MSKSQQNNDNVSGEEIEEAKEQLEEIEEEIDEAETLEELQETETDLERMMTWAKDNLLAPIVALTSELQKANELKAAKLEAKMRQHLPGPTTMKQDQELEPEQEPENPLEAINPENPQEKTVEEVTEPEKTTEQKTRRIIRL